jgi:hypothetical protein
MVMDHTQMQHETNSVVTEAHAMNELPTVRAAAIIAGTL